MSQSDPFQGQYARVVESKTAAGRWDIVGRIGQVISRFPYAHVEAANRRARKDEKRLAKQARERE